MSEETRVSSRLTPPPPRLRLRLHSLLRGCAAGIKLPRRVHLRIRHRHSRSEPRPRRMGAHRFQSSCATVARGALLSAGPTLLRAAFSTSGGRYPGGSAPPHPPAAGAGQRPPPAAAAAAQRLDLRCAGRAAAAERFQLGAAAAATPRLVACVHVWRALPREHGGSAPVPAWR